MTDKIYDTLIIGAGPSGSAAAIELAKAGKSVLLIDKKSFPREKVCGDGLVGDSIRVLKKLDVYDEVKEKGYSSSRVELIPEKAPRFEINGNIITLKREILDNILLQKAISLNVEFIIGKFTGKVHDSQKYSFAEIVTSTGIITVKYKFLLLATGCQNDGTLRTLLPKIKKPSLVAIRGYYKADWPIEKPMAVFIKDLMPGYLWIFPMGNDIFNLGCGRKIGNSYRYSLHDILEKYIQKKLNKKYHTSGVWVSKPKGAMLRDDFVNIKFASKNNILLTGELLGTTYPFTGEGIGKALDSGILAAETINAALEQNSTEPLRKYTKLIRKKYGHYYFAYRAAYYFSLISYFRHKMFNKAASSQHIKDSIADFIDDNKKIKIMHAIKRIILFAIH